MVFIPIKSAAVIAMALNTAIMALPTGNERLYARTGSFHTLSTGGKTAAKNFVAGAPGHALTDAASGGSSARTTHQNSAFHLDRQQPSSSSHQSKVAVQLNNVGKGQPSTVGQVTVPHGFNPPPKTVAAKLKHSINTGQEQAIKAHRIKREEYPVNELYARTGSFHSLSTGGKTAAKNFVAGAPGHALTDAASGGSSARTTHQNGGFHLDRQQPSSSSHQSKVAVQLNNVGKGQPSTVGQVTVPHGFNPPPKTVAAKLKHSINTGKEQDIKAHRIK